MSKKQKIDDVPIECVRRACADLPENEVLEAEEVFKNHMRLVVDIVDSINIFH